MANVKKADLFLSVHINANRSSKIHGFETYYLNLARSASAVRVAARENAVSEKRISDLQFILTDLMLNSKMQESKDLAELIQGNVIGTVKGKYGYPTRDNGVRSAPFYVLMGAKMPSVLMELGYCTNDAEARRLKSDNYLNRMADGIVAGVVAYKKKINRYASM
jgi:N-acetylmuramoyl-L-alanine amidase